MRIRLPERVQRLIQGIFLFVLGNGELCTVAPLAVGSWRRLWIRRGLTWRVSVENEGTIANGGVEGFVGRRDSRGEKS